MADPRISAPSVFRPSIGAAWLQRRLVQRKYALTRDNRYCGGSEDTACNHSNIRFVCYWAGSNHASNDAVSYFRRSYDRGFSWEPEELLDEDITPRFTGTFAMGFMRGRRFRITRKSSEGGSVGMHSLKMYSQRFIDRWNMTTPFVTTIGSSTITVHANVNGTPIKHGLLNGDTIHFNGVGSLFGTPAAGPVISAGAYVVSDVTASTFTIVASSGAVAPSAGVVAGKNAFAYVYETANNEVQFMYGSGGSENFGQALLAAIPGASGLPNMIKSFSVLDDNTVAIAVTGSGIRGWARLNNVFDGTPSINYWPFPSITGHFHGNLSRIPALPDSQRYPGQFPRVYTDRESARDDTDNLSGVLAGSGFRNVQSVSRSIPCAHEQGRCGGHGPLWRRCGPGSA